MNVISKKYRPGCVIELDGDEQRLLREELRELTAEQDDPSVASELADWLETPAIRWSESK